MKKFFNKKLAMLMAVAMVMAMSALPAFAAEGDVAVDAVDTVTTAMTTGVQNFAAKAGVLLGVMIVSALGFAGAKWLAQRGFSWFKSMAK